MTKMLRKQNAGSMAQKYCCGCGLCSNFVDGDYNEKGYYRPDADVLTHKFDIDYCYSSSLDSMVSEGLWGKYKAIYYTYSNDNYVRNKASSGGTLTEVAAYLLASGQVDFIVHASYSHNSKIKTEISISSTRQEVIEKCGSRYTASALLENIFDILDQKKRYAFIGKPCDIKVLRTYLQKNPEWNRSIVFLLSFFCGGTPSYQANVKLLHAMELEEENLTMFTYRGNGWPGKATGSTKDGRTKSMDYENSWGRILGRDLQDICRFCWDGVGMAADISCGDGWYLENGKPSFRERPGRNITFARTDKGYKVLQEMKQCGSISLDEEKNEDILAQMQPGQFMRKAAMFSRVLAMRFMRKPVPYYEMRKLLPYAKLISVATNARMFYGTIKRIVQGRIK
mgnify:FL=1